MDTPASSGSSEIYRMTAAITASPKLAHKINSVPHAACPSTPQRLELPTLHMAFSVCSFAFQLCHDIGNSNVPGIGWGNPESSWNTFRDRHLPSEGSTVPWSHSKPWSLLHAPQAQGWLIGMNSSKTVRLTDFTMKTKNSLIEAQVEIQSQRNPSWDRLKPLLCSYTPGPSLL